MILIKNFFKGDNYLHPSVFVSWLNLELIRWTVKYDKKMKWLILFKWNILSYKKSEEYLLEDDCFYKRTLLSKRIYSNA